MKSFRVLLILIISIISLIFGIQLVNSTQRYDDYVHIRTVDYTYQGVSKSTVKKSYLNDSIKSLVDIYTVTYYFNDDGRMIYHHKEFSSKLSADMYIDRNSTLSVSKYYTYTDRNTITLEGDTTLQDFIIGSTFKGALLILISMILFSCIILYNQMDKERNQYDRRV